MTVEFLFSFEKGGHSLHVPPALIARVAMEALNPEVLPEMADDIKLPETEESKEAFVLPGFPDEGTSAVSVSATGITYGLIISTVAGDGERGHSGDGGPATNGWLNFPRNIDLPPLMCPHPELGCGHINGGRSLQFLDFEMPVDGDEVALLATGGQDQAVGAKKQPVVDRQGNSAIVQENQIEFEGKMLDGRIQNAVSGGGLFGLISFIKTGSAKLAKPTTEQSVDPYVRLKEITLFSVGRKKTIQNAGTVFITETAPSPDFDGDGEVGFSDFILFARVYGAEEGDGTFERRYDLNLDGRIAFEDFVEFARKYGETL